MSVYPGEVKPLKKIDYRPHFGLKRIDIKILKKIKNKTEDKGQELPSEKVEKKTGN